MGKKEGRNRYQRWILIEETQSKHGGGTGQVHLLMRGGVKVFVDVDGVHVAGERVLGLVA